MHELVPASADQQVFVALGLHELGHQHVVVMLFVHLVAQHLAAFLQSFIKNSYFEIPASHSQLVSIFVEVETVELIVFVLDGVDALSSLDMPVLEHSFCIHSHQNVFSFPLLVLNGPELQVCSRHRVYVFSPRLVEPVLDAAHHGVEHPHTAVMAASSNVLIVIAPLGAHDVGIRILRHEPQG